MTTTDRPSSDIGPTVEPQASPHVGLPWAWVVVATVIVVAFYPGIMSNDSLASLQQARSLQFTSWHPPIMALIWGVLDRIVAGPVLMLVAQACLYAIACARLCAVAFPRLMQRFSPWLLVPVFALFPPVMALNGMIWKDVWMSALLMLALASLIRLATGPRERRRRSFAMLLLFCLLATAFRHNALAATAGLLAGGCYYLAPAWHTGIRLLASCVAGVVLALLLSLLVSAATRVIAEPAHVTTPILLHDIAGIIVESGNPEAASREALALAPSLSDNRKVFAKRIVRRYDPAAAGRVLRTSRRKDAPFAINVYDPRHDAAAVRHAWIGLIKRHPGAYIRHRYNAFRCLLQLCGANGWAQHSYVLNQAYVSPDGANPVQKSLRVSLLNPALVRLYAPIFWLAISLAGMIFGLVRIRSGMSSLLFMGLSTIGLATSLFFTSPIESYRYMHWTIMVAWVAIWIGLDAHSRPRQEAAAS